MILELPDGVADQRCDGQEAILRRGAQPRCVLIEINRDLPAPG
jgi:hypothetical protein